jgi:phosphate-selective porin
VRFAKLARETTGPKSSRRLLFGLLLGAGVLQVSAVVAQTVPATPPSVAATNEPAAPPAGGAPLAPAPAAPAPAPEEPRARLDYSDGSFYLRAANDNIVFVPAARVHMDVYGFAGPGVADYHKSNGSGLKLNLFFRRFIIEFGGLIRHKWFYWVGGNFAPTTIDANQAPLASANVYDGFVGYLPTSRIRIYFGQYNAPFTMENVTSSRWLDLMERALSVRTLATPYNKADGLTVWGETEHKEFEYQVGVFGGDGMNRQSLDNRVDGMTRLVVRPLAKRDDALKRFHFGVGARLGYRDPEFVAYDAPALSTPGGYTFWAPTYTAEDGTKMHIVAAGRQTAASAEVYVPFERFDVRGEFIYINENRHEVAETAKLTALRGGTFKGVGGYVQLSLWLLGTPRINGNPAGTYGVLKLPDGLGAQAPYALQLVLRGEGMHMNYDGNARNGGKPGKLSASTDDIRVNAYQIGLNYWATKHVRLTAEYSLYQFPGNIMTNQAKSPGLAADATSDANLLHEFSLRCGLAI